MERIIMIKYGELTTKGANRKVFIKKLVDNINDLLGDYKFEIKYDRVRMYIEVDNKYIDEFAEKLSKIFGIHEIVICYCVTNNVSDIKNKVSDVLEKVSFKTFKVYTKRADKSFPISSMEFNDIVGGYILRNFDVKVDVHNPEILLTIEIRAEGTFIYLNGIKGLGGYPVGIQDRGLLMLSGGIDSPVAGYLSLKRGIDLECIYFDSPPHTSLGAKNKVLELASILNNYSGNIKVNVAPFTELQEAIYKNVPENYGVTIMRRMMYRIATRYAMKTNCKVIVNGESIGQVASQTLSSISVINAVTNMPVIRPVACLDKLEIVDISKYIGTYETSILPYEDCCTIFIPKHPVINPDLEKCIKYESSFDYDSMIERCIDNIEVIKDLNQNKHKDLL